MKTLSLAFITLLASVIPNHAVDFISHSGTYESRQKTIKLVIAEKPDKQIRYRVYFSNQKDGGASALGPSTAVPVTADRWGFYFEDEKRVWFYDGRTIMCYENNFSGMGRKMPPEVAAWYEAILKK